MKPLILFLLLSFSASGTEILFDRSMCAGKVYDCVFESKQSSQVSLDLSGKEKPVTQQETLQVSLSGFLQAEKIGSTGFPEKFRFQVKQFQGSFNGVPVNTGDLKGRVLSVEFAEGKTSFSLAGGNLPEQQQRLLRALFRSSASRLPDLTGPRRNLKKGEMFPVNLKKLCAGFQAGKIPIREKDIQGAAVYTGTASFRKIPCHALKLKISSGLRDFYDFRFRAEVMLPADASVSVPFCFLKRETTEVVNHFLPGGNPLSAGSSVQMVNTDFTTVEILPGKQRVLKDAGERPWSSLLR